MTEKTQFNFIRQSKLHIGIIKNPTEKAIALNNLLWKL